MAVSNLLEFCFFCSWETWELRGGGGRWGGYLCVEGKREISKACVPFHWNLHLLASPFWNKLTLLSSTILIPVEKHLIVRAGSWVSMKLLRRTVLLKLSKGCRIKPTRTSPERCAVKAIRAVSRIAPLPGFWCENEGLITFVFIMLTCWGSHKERSDQKQKKKKSKNNARRTQWHTLS